MPFYFFSKHLLKQLNCTIINFTILKQLILVFLGGGLGSMIRYLLVKIIPNTNSSFPWGTFAVNLIGCFILGIIMGYTLRFSMNSKSDIILFFAIGVCGGFTTFSAFAYENYAFMRLDNYLVPFVYVSASIFFGVIMIYLGFLFEKFIFLKIQ